jgi:hypothetical protein
MRCPPTRWCPRAGTAPGTPPPPDRWPRGRRRSGPGPLRGGHRRGYGCCMPGRARLSGRSRLTPGHGTSTRRERHDLRDRRVGVQPSWLALRVPLAVESSTNRIPGQRPTRGRSHPAFRPSAHVPVSGRPRPPPPAFRRRSLTRRERGTGAGRPRCTAAHQSRRSPEALSRLEDRDDLEVGAGAPREAEHPELTPQSFRP